MYANKINDIQRKLGGKIIIDSYPYPTRDRELWMELLAKAQRRGIGLYGSLIKIRAIGAVLEPNEKFGYIIKPLIRGVNGVKWGWASEELYKKEKETLKPYTAVIMELLKELKDEGPVSDKA